MKYNYSRLFFVLFFLGVVFSQAWSQTTVTGCAPDYAGSELILNSYSDPFTGSEKEISRCPVDKQGNFSLKFQIQETQSVFLHLGIYNCNLYVKPGVNYQVVLPSKKLKSPADEVNPYFEETTLALSARESDGDSLNAKILAFDDRFYPCLNKFLLMKRGKTLFHSLDSAILTLSVSFTPQDTNYFENYVKYRIGLLRFLVFQHPARSTSDSLFLTRKILYHNTAYIELFNQVYDKYFLFFGRTKKGEKIYDDIGRDKSYAELRQTLGSDLTLGNKALLELVILKGLHDEFYGSNFSRSALLNVLDSLRSSTQIEEHRSIADHIRAKVTRLLPGFEPPPFTLYNADSTLVKLSDFKGKWVYLNFGVTMSYTCMKEDEILDRLEKKFKGQFKIVTVSFDDNFKTMRNYVKRKGYTWTFLYCGNQTSLLKEYNIRAFPTCYLINPDGKLSISPAPLPSENIELTIFSAMRSRGDL
ncbi:MAG: TlpA disulfide reductase family protein [Bacteroidota bacterium]|nr:TlpA disulfide reductase family protein [Bacteroidota bacterium]